MKWVVSFLISSRFGCTQVHLKSFTRAASGKIDDHVWIEKLDLRTHLQAPPSAPEGIDLLALCNKPVSYTHLRAHET